MAPRDRSDERRAALLPAVAATFADLGYRRATTAELARRCGVQETILYRLWDDKRAMFVAAIDFVYENSERIWRDFAEEPDAAERLLSYETSHHGEFGLYRIVFAGLSEADDPEIRAALGRMYKRFHAYLERLIGRRRRGRAAPGAAAAAWALVGLGTVTNIARELELLGPRQRRRLAGEVGRLLLGSR